MDDRDTAHTYRPGDLAIVNAEHAGRFNYNVNSQARQLKPGDVVTILGRFPDCDDDQEAGTDGLAYEFEHPEIKPHFGPDSGGFVLHAVMIDPLPKTGWDLLDSLADAWIADIGNHVAREAFYDALVAAGKIGGMTDDYWHEHENGAKFWADVRSGEWWTISVA